MRPHHDGSALHVSDPAPALGDTVTVFVRVPRGTRTARVHLRRLQDGDVVNIGTSEFRFQLRPLGHAGDPS